MATVTAAIASSTGMPAAISDPNTTSSKISVTGTEVSSALWKSLPSAVPTALSMLAPPASATRRPGNLTCTSATAACAGCTAVVELSGLPGTWNVTSALCPSADTRWLPPGPNGDRISDADFGRAASAATTWRVACRIVASVENWCPGVRAWISTLSVGAAYSLPVSWCKVRSACPAWPGIVGRHALGAQRVARDEHHGHQQQPGPHRDLLVPGAPPGNPFDQRAGPPRIRTLPPAAGPADALALPEPETRCTAAASSASGAVLFAGESRCGQPLTGRAPGRHRTRTGTMLRRPGKHGSRRGKYGLLGTPAFFFFCTMCLIPTRRRGPTLAEPEITGG